MIRHPLHVAFFAPGDDPPGGVLQRLDADAGLQVVVRRESELPGHGAQVLVIWAGDRPREARKALEGVMKDDPVPVVVLGVDDEGLWRSRGAVLALGVGPDADGARLAELIRSASQVRPVVHPRPPESGRVPVVTLAPPAAGPSGSAVVGIASSSGGPGPLAQVLANLPQGFAAPILVAQHIQQDSVTFLARTLARHTRLPVSVARSGELVGAGRVLLAPGDAHLELTPERRVRIRACEESDRDVPSADLLFESLSRVCGSRAVGVVLSGMGHDGARGARAIRAGGGRVYAQDEASCAVFGMPKAARDGGGVDALLPPMELARALVNALGVGGSRA